MSICKEEFISALRVAVSAEFLSVPDDENAINFCFSNGFNKKMQKLIKSQKKPYWNLIKTAPKRAAAVCAAIAVLICGAFCVKPVRVSAKEMLEEIIVKTKSIFQTAYENGIPLSEVDSGGDFKYTEFDGEERVTRQDGASPSVTGETFADPKTDIYNKMLNTIDHFNTVELSVNIHLSGDDLTVNSYADIDRSLAYEAVYDRNRLTSETFCGSENDFLTIVDHNQKTYSRQYLKKYRRADSPYIPLEERIITSPDTGDGLPCYCYRVNATNCPMASFSMLPEGLAFSYLSDFERWSIAEDGVDYLGRSCVKITGTTKPSSAEKHNNDSFMMLVDKNTGILMKFEGYKNGGISGYITVTKCTVDGDTAIKKFDESEYPSYTEGEQANYIKRNK